MEKEQIKLLNQVLNEPEKHEKAIKEFSHMCMALVGENENEVLQEIITHGVEKFEAKFKAHAMDQLSKAGLTSLVLKQTLLKGCDEFLVDFKNILDGLIQSAVAVNNKVAFDKITKTQMEVEGIYVGGYCTRYITDQYKRLHIGIGGGLMTKCKKSINVGHCKIEILANDDVYYIYAKWPRSGGDAVLVVFNEPQANTDKDFYMLWKSGTFNQIKF